jgi:hypothetical protein
MSQLLDFGLLLQRSGFLIFHGAFGPLFVGLQLGNLPLRLVEGFLHLAVAGVEAGDLSGLIGDFCL